MTANPIAVGQLIHTTHLCPKCCKRILTAYNPGAFTESPEEMVNRVCNDLGKHREIMVITDEAHHCYRGKPESAKEKKKTRRTKSAASVK